jgi:hypothetical protein
MDLTAETINELFLQKLDSKEGMDKVAQAGSAFIRQKIREVSFARKIINPEYVTQADCQRSVQHEGLVKIVDIEPDSTATIINFRGEPDTTYVAGERFEIPFFAVASDDFQKTEEELLAYEMPLTDVIERNSIKDIQRQEDSSWMSKFDAAIALDSSNQSASVTLDSDGSIKKSSFVTLFDMLDGNELKTDVLLMNSKTFNKLLLYPATSVGDQVGSQVVINGYTYATLFGRKLIVTNKVDLVGDVVYAFAAQEYLGKFFILNDLKFWVDKKRNIITWGAYETIGGGIGNTKGVVKITW